jgi:hypothetical protein
MIGNIYIGTLILLCIFYSFTFVVYIVSEIKDYFKYK